MLLDNPLTEVEIASALYDLSSFADGRLQLLIITPEKFMIYHSGILHESRVVKPLSSVSSIIFRQPGVLGDGYLQFIVDGIEPRVGGFDSVVKDPCSFAFGTKFDSSTIYATFSDIVNAYSFVQDFVKTSRRNLEIPVPVSMPSPTEHSSNLQHIEKLKTISDLYAKGHLTQEEYASLKQDVLGAT